MALQKCGISTDENGRELVAHGTASFPCSGYDTLYRAGEDFLWHWHDELEIIMIEDGIMEIRGTGLSFPLSGGDLVIINSGVLHYGVAVEDTKIASLVFSPLLITGSNDSVFMDRYIGPLMASGSFSFFVIRNGEIPKLTTLFSNAFSCLVDASPGYEFRIRSNLSEILLYLHEYYQEDFAEIQQNDTDSRRIRQMLDFIHKHYSEDIGLRNIADSAMVGERECLRCFRRSLQISPVQYLLKHRTMTGAKLLAERRDMNVAEVALACGFKDAGSFSRFFRRYYQMTPKAYRNRH